MMVQEPEPLSALIRRFRLVAGFSQEQLAERAGLSARAISDLERGLRGRTRPETLRMLAAALTLNEEEREALLRAANPDLRQSPVTGNVAFAPEHSLPAPTSMLIGREREVAAIAALLGGIARLVTLTGPGGVGKTTLALEAARLAAPRFADGVVFVDLAPVSESEQVASAIAQTLGLHESGERAIRETLGISLHNRQLLLLLDNFEQVIEAAPLVSELLGSATSLRVLVTSREALRVRGEEEVVVEPLPLPAEHELLDLKRVAESPSVGLFVARAGAVKQGFALTAENAGAIASICRRLDGLPLAIELAASRVKHFPPALLLERLD